MICSVLMETLNPTHSLVHYCCYLGRVKLLSASVKRCGA